METTHVRTWLALLGLGLAVGCQGKIGGKDDTAPAAGGPSPSTFECDASAEPAELPLRRLSRIQYVNSVHEVVRRTLPTKASAVLTSLEPLFLRLPDDRRVAKDDDKRGGFRRLDQVVQQGHADVQYDLAIALGKTFTADAATLSAVVGACATDADSGNDKACLEEFVRRFGLLVQRRPLGDDDVKFYADIAGATPVAPAALADVVAALLASPRFVYHVEHGVPGGGPNVALDPYELASRVSYHFWQTMPDEALLAAAASGKLGTDAGYAAEVARVFADPRTDAALDAFALEWLWLDDLPAMDARVGDPIFDAFAAGFTPTATLRDALVADTLAAFRHVVRKGGGFADFFLESRSFSTDPAVSSIYGVAAATKDPVAVPGRVGLLTRPALLATGSANTRPIMKGVFIRKGLLCDDIPPPPAEAAKVKPELSDTQTTREVVEALTQQKGTACNGCHATMINPLGFSTENFDAFGRPRATQRLFDATGKVVAEKPVDTTSTPQVTATDQRSSTGAADVTRYLLESGRVQACFARQWFRFSFGRLEDDKKDGCALKAASEATQGGKGIADVLQQMALQPAFRRRTFR